MKSAVLIKEPRSAGWELDPVNGSHPVFCHSGRPGHVMVPQPKKDLGIGLVRAIRTAKGL
ncbi:type II toxin-antitoxin system HicA family toxin [Hydrogenophaga sp.]|uniref:type II toxin-antitoxin system HicA family toxin n=1 Tax=Hydrogenophaga sp. TaxID=1904254 RepID=UPI003F6AAC22